ncbi:hypothetical protein IV203_015686 [Nitzschia inconspicua]|uniref:Uncharacterized protein n=1 Tax=Nitzschia inconspicua TaxID=303405 RepID=A0A9K3PTI8_9STRA|nr:hypothetical protein IV203_015686 [Nitzschia inconspicua]
MVIASSLLVLWSLAKTVVGFIPATGRSVAPWRHPVDFVADLKIIRSTVKDDDFSFDNIADSNENESPTNSANPFLGIDLRQQLLPDTEDEYSALKKACSDMIDEKVRNGMQELQNLREKWMRDLEHQQEPLEQAMTLNGMRESEKFQRRVDLLVGSFMNQTAVSRTQTHQLAFEDRQRLEAAERELERKQKQKGVTPSFNGWKKTNNEWDEWEDDW